MSKGLLDKFNYDYIKSKYSSNSRLLFTNTASLIYKIKTEDVYEDFSKYKEMIDSGWSKYDSNKLVVGKMKDETSGLVIEECVVLKPKMYSFLVDDRGEHKK